MPKAFNTDLMESHQLWYNKMWYFDLREDFSFKNCMTAGGLDIQCFGFILDAQRKAKPGAYDIIGSCFCLVFHDFFTTINRYRLVNDLVPVNTFSGKYMHC